MLDPRDALLGVIVGAIHADGRVRPIEVSEAEAHLAAIPGLASASHAEVASLLPTIERRVAQVGAQRFMDECAAALPADLRVRAFRAVADVIAADHEVLPVEERYLARLATAFHVEAPRA